jgi:hypothetical protein
MLARLPCLATWLCGLATWRLACFKIKKKKKEEKALLYLSQV